MAKNFILLHYDTKSWNQQIVDSATLFATRVKYMEILQEQFAGLFAFSFTLSILLYVYQISNIFLDTHTVSGQLPVTKFCLISEFFNL